MWEAWEQSCLAWMFSWNNQTGDYWTEAVHLQHVRPAEAQCISPSSPLPVIDAIVPSASSACPGNEFWKLTVLLARKLKDEIPIKKKKIWVKCCLLIQALWPAICRCCQKTSTANSAGAHQRWRKYRESLYAASLKHSHGERASVFPYPHKEH